MKRLIELQKQLNNHQTVKDIKEYLSQYPDNMPVYFHTSNRHDLGWLSDYTDDAQTRLEVDIGREGE